MLEQIASLPLILNNISILQNKILNDYDILLHLFPFMKIYIEFTSLLPNVDIFNLHQFRAIQFIGNK